MCQAEGLKNPTEHVDTIELYVECQALGIFYSALVSHFIRPAICAQTSSFKSQKNFKSLSEGTFPSGEEHHFDHSILYSPVKLPTVCTHWDVQMIKGGSCPQDSTIQRKGSVTSASLLCSPEIQAELLVGAQ